MKFTSKSEKIQKFIEQRRQSDKSGIHIPVLDRNVIFTDIFEKLYNYYHLSNYNNIDVEYEKKKPENGMMPNTIINHLHKYNHCYKFEFHVNAILFNIEMFFSKLPSENTLKSMIDKITMGIQLIHSYSKSSVERVDMCIIFTDLKKTLPGNSVNLDEEHVNSAFVTNCSTVKTLCIYRSEEWFKVMIHELIHAFNIDFSCHNQSQNDAYLHSLFPIKSSNFRLYEAYTELWAILIHSSFVSFFHTKNKKDIDKMFETLVKFVMDEFTFSHYQFTKIMDFSKIKDITDPNSTYVENTHVLSYYIFKFFCFIQVNEFIDLCTSQNKKISMVFKNDDKNIKKLCDLVFAGYKKLKGDDINFESVNDKFISTTLRMSAFEF